MPVYNAERYVRIAIESILRQTGVEFELIVVDDGSTDQSLEVVRSFSDPRLTILTQTNAGYGSAMNAGMAIASGKYIARMDSDDLSRPGRLEQQALFLNARPEFVMCGTLWNYVTPNGHESPFLDQQDLSWEEQTWEMIMTGHRQFSDPTVMFRMDAARKIGGYRTFQRSGLDVDLWLRLLENDGRAAVINQVLYTWRIGNESLSDNPMSSALNKIPRFLARERKAVGTDRVMRGETLAGIITPEILEKAQYWHVQRQWDLALICFQARDWAAAFKFIRRGLVKGGVTTLNLRRLLATLRGGAQMVMHLPG